MEICKIARITFQDKEIQYAGEWFKILDCMLPNKNHVCDIVQIIEETKMLPFDLKFVKDEHDTASLMLCYTGPSRSMKQDATVFNKILPIVFKNYEDPLSATIKQAVIQANVYDEENKNSLLKKYVTTKLYDLLYKQHVRCASDWESIPFTLPDSFQSKLCNYQEKTVGWLLEKERVISVAPSFYKKLIAIDGMHIIYKHKYCSYLMSEESSPIVVPMGGILADEMGLGKTVEILALILLNPRQEFTIPQNIDDDTLSSDDEILANYGKRARYKSELLCVCVSKKTKNLIRCTKCFKSQHRKCVSTYDEDHSANVNEPYMCPACWEQETKTNLIESGATVIVSPTTIKMQWYAEIKKHIQPTLRVLVYKGISSGSWISPRQMANYDIVLTDYNVLRSEVYHTSEYETQRVTRNKRVSLRLSTPLLMVQWWRVCLDEAQMVESNQSKIAALARILPAINRWAVSGTPIQRSIDDICSLLQFIGFKELCEPVDIWNNLVHNFVISFEESEKVLELVKVLQLCMWRTCKSNVENEINIPEQTETIHRIDLDNLEKLFYTEQHSECKNNFDHNVYKYINSNACVLTISPQILTQILKPLLKIRQSCIIPVVIGNKPKTSGQTLQKQFMNPNELHSHLKTTNENDCKAQLRTMASSYNGMAAINFIRGDYKEAIRFYNAVLKLARDYNEKPIYVDSLLQIHALHNMLQAMDCSGTRTTIVEDYEAEKNALEWKYIQQYVSVMRTVELDYESSKEAYENLLRELDMPLLNFLSTLSELVLREQDQLHEPLMHKIFDECQISFPKKVHAIESVRSLLYTVSIWMEKVNKLQKKLYKEFESIKFFTNNVRERKNIDEDMWCRMLQFISTVSDCHLYRIRKKNNEDDEEQTKNREMNFKRGAPKKKNDQGCKLCTIKNLLDECESLFFNKNKNQEGKKLNTMEVVLIKVFLNFMKTKQRFYNCHGNIDKYLEVFESMQSLLKKQAKFWIEIEYTIKAYDELDMCKTRITLTEDEDDDTNFKILELELAESFTAYKYVYQAAQHDFTTKLARLRYINHLNSNAENGPCPICQLETETRYAVLDCGHHICFLCLQQMQRMSKDKRITCSICRHVQNTHKYAFVFYKLLYFYT
ncbi:E3 ubiquitin-protein ligase SHPRH-like [Teleopsis dalmanni]|uniref:E3 ubiquitin-protein ligase SHPRH-like n=1 Tax=Teleopsis dalmanni TaxID=139649 RepID=UPI0018CFA097|nr:E3 ubiquitin-protein ligase SHPRH-like [Teleopsis dalmanni]